MINKILELFGKLNCFQTSGLSKLLVFRLQQLYQSLVRCVLVRSLFQLIDELITEQHLNIISGLFVKIKILPTVG